MFNPKNTSRKKNKSKFSDWSGNAIGFHILHQIQKQLFIILEILKKSQEHTREGVIVQWQIFIPQSY